MYRETIEMPSIIFEVKSNKFSIPSSHVESIIKLPEVTPLPNSSDNVKGVIRYRNELYNIIDFRRTLSIISTDQEINNFVEMIDQREKDHINWLIELENSVKENREFQLTTDPHQCAFGKWYDNYKTDNSIIKETLSKFNLPHKKIHKIALEIEQYLEKHKFDDAKTLIEKTRNKELNRMKNLFKILKNQLKNSYHESVILFKNDARRFGLSVDKIHSVEHVKEVETKNLDTILLDIEKKNFIMGLVENKNKELIISVSENLIYY